MSEKRPPAFYLIQKRTRKGKKYLVPEGPDFEDSEAKLAAPRLDVVIRDEQGSRTLPVFSQSAMQYGKDSLYVRMHGCACCSLTTLLAAYCGRYQNLRPQETIHKVERKHFPKRVWKRNYNKNIRRQMPVSLYGIAVILREEGIKNRYVGAFQDREAAMEIRRHLLGGQPVVIETSRVRRKNGRAVRHFDTKYAGSYHTMILLGFTRQGEVVFTDSATRTWGGERQRLKTARLCDLIRYMFPQRNTEDASFYFTRRKNTGGYILIDA